MEGLTSDSSALTPPSSPPLEECTPRTFRYFSCKGTVNVTNCDLNEDGYLKSGYFNRLLRSELYDYSNDDECCEVFGMTIVKSSIVNHLESIVSMAKKYISMMQAITQQVSKNSLFGINSSECFHIRKNFFPFLHHVKAFVINLTSHKYKYLSSSTTFNLLGLLTVLLKEWRGLLMFLGRISDLPKHVICLGVSQNGNASTSAYHLFHLYLDIWWSAVELLYVIDTVVTKNELNLLVDYSRPLIPGCEDFFSQVILLLLWDLCFVAVNCHNNLLPSDYQTVTPFTCTCIYEIWIMIIHLLDYRQKQENKCFWNHIHYLFQRILSPSLPNVDNDDILLELFILEPESFKSTNPIGFCMWLLTHIASLYKYDSIGNYISDIKIQRNYSSIQSLINLSLSAHLEKNDDAQIRCILHCCHIMCSSWETNIDIILPIIDYFLKKINESFQLKFGIQSMAFTKKSSQLWLEEIKEIVNNKDKIKMSDTIFQIFLRLLSLQLSKIGSDKNNYWRQIKGRVYSKFHSRRMKELSEIGIFNCFTLFLVLADTTDLSDIGSKLCDLAVIIRKGSMGINKEMISWKAIFTLMAIYQGRNIDISPLTNNISDHFNQVCINFSQNENQHSLMLLINTYFEGVQNVIHNSDSLTLSEYLLFEKGLDILLSKCKGNSLGPLLSTIEIVLKKLYLIFQINKCPNIIFNEIQSSIHDHYIKIFSMICEYVLPFLYGHAITPSPLPQTALITSTLTYFSILLKIPVLNSKLNFSELFNYFGSNFKINADMICDYLCIILKEKEILGSFATVQCNIVIRSWFRCCLCIIPPSKKMQEFTQLLTLLPQPSNFLKQIDYHGEKHDELFIHFCCKFPNFSTEEKLALKNILHYALQDFVLSLTALLKTPTNISREMISHIYNLCSSLVEHCAPVLYVKSKPDCILPTLIDTVILPHVIYVKNKEVPSVLLGSIEEHMASFVRGLTKMNFSTDPYIQRKLKDIIIQYLPRFLIKRDKTNLTAKIHPLLKTLIQLPSTVASEFMIFVIEVIRDHFIKRGGSSYQHFSLSILFLTELFNYINFTQKKNLISKLLPSFLDQLLLNEDNFTDQQLMEFILKMIKTCENELGLDFRTDFLLPSLETFLQHNLPWKTNRVFKLMQDLSGQFPKLSTDLIPILLKQVQIIEKKRGVGLDQSLRHGLSLIIKKLEDNKP
ncbi:protein MMS22-like [Centruroides vittatus]|uniref:protein MMS22-like n=1 Tax=Centruroides vittatus TaxID=120091 RepID=UPI00350EF784